MAWVDSIDNTQLYKEDRVESTVWDGGDARWDVFGNTIISYWDTPSGTTYSDSTNNTQVWTDQ